jgi:hypothetical protein
VVSDDDCYIYISYMYRGFPSYYHDFEGIWSSLLPQPLTLVKLVSVLRNSPTRGLYVFRIGHHVETILSLLSCRYGSIY